MHFDYSSLSPAFECLLTVCWEGPGDLNVPKESTYRQCLGQALSKLRASLCSKISACDDDFLYSDIREIAQRKRTKLEQNKFF